MRWKEYYEELMNGENEREERTVEAPENGGDVNRISGREDSDGEYEVGEACGTT